MINCIIKFYEFLSTSLKSEHFDDIFKKVLLNGKGPAGDFDNRGTAEVLRERTRINRSAHQNNSSQSWKF